MVAVVSTGSETVRVNVRLEGEELAAVDRLCARWKVGRAEALRRAALEGARWANIESRLAAFEIELRAEVERRLEDVSGRLDHLWATVDERVPPGYGPESRLPGDPGEADPPEPPAEGEHGERGPSPSAGVDGLGALSDDHITDVLARRPGQGKPLAPLHQIVDGERLEIDVRSA